MEDFHLWTSTLDYAFQILMIIIGICLFLHSRFQKIDRKLTQLSEKYHYSNEENYKKLREIEDKLIILNENIEESQEINKETFRLVLAELKHSYYQRTQWTSNAVELVMPTKKRRPGRPPKELKSE